MTNMRRSRVSTSAVSMGKVGEKTKKGGIFPWLVNEPGTYAEVAMLSSYNFLGKDGDKFIGWGAMPNSVKALYTNGRGRGPMLSKSGGSAAPKAAPKPAPKAARAAPKPKPAPKPVAKKAAPKKAAPLFGRR